MYIAFSIQRHPTVSRRWHGILALFVIFFFPGAFAAQKQPVSREGEVRPSAKTDSGFAEAEQLLQQGLLDQAKEKIEEQLSLHSASVEGYNLLGIVYSEEKDYPRAQEAFQHALKLAPNSTQTRNNLANVDIALGQPGLAEKEFREVLRLDPANRDGNYNLGLLLMAKGSPAAAVGCFQRVRPQSLETRFNLVRAYFEAGRTADALKMANELSAGKKDDVQLHFTLGVLLAAEKQNHAAQLELEKANALQPETFEILSNLGQAYLRSRNNAKAELVLNRALNLKPDSTDALYLLAQVDTEEAKPLDALDLLVRAHKLAPENTDVIFLMARISMTENYFEDAIPLLESGLKIAPQRADLRAALGESYFMSGKEEKAIDEFRKLIAVDPSARSYAFMGLSYRHLGRFDEARKYFDEGLKRDSHNASCLFNLGYIEERQGNYARAEQLLQQALKTDPNLSEALLELANLRMNDKQFAAAVELLRKFVKVSHDPASGYYKLAMAEISLHQTEAAQRDMNVFQTLTKDVSTGPLPYQNLFDYLDNRSKLSAEQKTQLDVTELSEQAKQHLDQPQHLYVLAESYLKLGKVEEAQKAIAQLDEISENDYRTQCGVGVLLARYHLYDDAIRQFQAALRASPDSDAVKFDLADAYFRKGLYAEALQVFHEVSPEGRQDESYLALLGDIYAHLGDSGKAAEIFRGAIDRNPDNDQYYLSLTLVQLRENDVSGAERTLNQGLARIPGSGKILWGLGIVSVMQGKTAQAAQRFERAVDLLPEWAGSYSTLGIFYYQTGQIDKAREVLDRFKGSKASGLDVGRIEEALSRAPAKSFSLANQPMPMVARQQLLQFALTIADRTL
jgi:tetratricopeptide (TPR) repeat protein